MQQRFDRQVHYVTRSCELNIHTSSDLHRNDSLHLQKIFPSTSNTQLHLSNADFYSPPAEKTHTAVQNVNTRIIHTHGRAQSRRDEDDGDDED